MSWWNPVSWLTGGGDDEATVAKKKATAFDAEGFDPGGGGLEPTAVNTAAPFKKTGAPMPPRNRTPYGGTDMPQPQTTQLTQDPRMSYGASAAQGMMHGGLGGAVGGLIAANRFKKRNAVQGTPGDYGADQFAPGQFSPPPAAMGGSPDMNSDVIDGTTPMGRGKIVTRPTHAIVGENGPEMVVPLQRNDAAVRPGMAMPPTVRPSGITYRRMRYDGR